MEALIFPFDIKFHIHSSINKFFTNMQPNYDRNMADGYINITYLTKPSPYHTAVLKIHLCKGISLPSFLRSKVT